MPTASERGDRIRIGPQVGKVATSHLPPEESPPLQSGGTESELAHKWARWLHHPCRLGGHHRFRAGGRLRTGAQVGKVATSSLPPQGSPTLQSGGTESEVAHKWARWLHHPCRLGVPTASERGDRIRSGPQVGKVATSSLPPQGSPTLQIGGTESEVAHKWARWLHHPCRLGVPTASERGDRIRSGPQVGKVATSPLPPGGSPPLQSGGTESEVPRKCARWLHHLCRLGGPHGFRAGGQNPKWPTSGQGGYITPAASEVPTASERADRIRGGPQVGMVATSPLPPEGSPTLQSGGQNQNWPTSGQGGYITPAALGVPTASERGAESEVAHKWARWLHHPCRLGGPHRFRAGGQNQKWPTSGQGGYITPAV